MEHPFYDQEIVRDDQEAYIEALMKRFKGREVNDELKKEIWNELQNQKHKGNITIPFKMATRKDPTGKFPDYIEVILDSKV